ncbi:IucC family-domain-containing protein, partial [Piptocephalis cylindrospora]
LSEGLYEELASSVDHATYAISHRPNPPTLACSSIDWEQSLVEGHPTHPMHRSRYAVDPLLPIEPVSTPLNHITIAFVAFPREDVLLRADFDSWIFRILRDAGQSLPTGDDTIPANWTILPAHPLQLPNIHKHFPRARVLPGLGVPARAQASLRTVVPDCTPDIAIKLALGIKVTSALRTVTRWTTYQGPGMARIMDKMEARYRNLRILREVASAVPQDLDHDVAKHAGCIIRQEPSLACPPGEQVILCAGLVEADSTETPHCIRLFSLDSHASRVDFLTRYVDSLFQCLLLPVLEVGFAFESHGQNTLVRLDPTQPGKILGFAIRDFGGIKADTQKLKSVLDEDLDVLPGSFTKANDIKEVYGVAFHTLIQNHLQALIRALDLHYSGEGWKITRDLFATYIPSHDPLWDYFMAPMVDLKCFVSMKLDGLYRDYVYRKVPNVLLY